MSLKIEGNAILSLFNAKRASLGDSLTLSCQIPAKNDDGVTILLVCAAIMCYEYALAPNGKGGYEKLVNSQLLGSAYQRIAESEGESETMISLMLQLPQWNLGKFVGSIHTSEVLVAVVVEVEVSFVRGGNSKGGFLKRKVSFPVDVVGVGT